MKTNEVKVGGLYVAKVSGNLVQIRIDSTHSRKGWNATNTATGKRVHIKSPQRLRGPARAKVTKAEAKEAVTAVIANDANAAATAKQPDVTPTVEIVTGQPVPAPEKKTRVKEAGEPKPKRISALNAAAEVLRKAGTPMSCKAMIATMAKQGLWQSPNGKTPHATLYAAILRELGAKGDAARFCKVTRGQFAFNG